MDIFGKNYAGYTRHQRSASRGILLRDGRILLSHETAIDQWMIPGGGAEGDETPEQCCAREFAEETGLLVRPEKCFLVLNEYYEDWKYASYFFLCSQTGATERRLTDRERAVGATPEWLPLRDALALFSTHGAYDGIDEERRGIYLREYTALTELLKTMDRKEDMKA